MPTLLNNTSNEINTIFNKNFNYESGDEDALKINLTKEELKKVVKVYEIIDRFFNYRAMKSDERERFILLLDKCITKDYDEFHQLVIDYFVNKVSLILKYSKIENNHGHYIGIYKDIISMWIKKITELIGSDLDNKHKKLLLSTIFNMRKTHIKSLVDHIDGDLLLPNI